IYIIALAKLKPHLAPPLSEEARRVPLPAFAQTLKETVGDRAVPALLMALKGRRNVDVSMGRLLLNLFIALMPAIVFVLAFWGSYAGLTKPVVEVDYGLQQMGGFTSFDDDASVGGLQEPAGAGGLQEPPTDDAPVALGADAAPAPAADSDAQGADTAVEP